MGLGLVASAAGHRASARAAASADYRHSLPASGPGTVPGAHASAAMPNSSSPAGATQATAAAAPTAGPQARAAAAPAAKTVAAEARTTKTVAAGATAETTGPETGAA